MPVVASFYCYLSPTIDETLHLPTNCHLLSFGFSSWYNCLLLHHQLQNDDEESTRNVWVANSQYSCLVVLHPYICHIYWLHIPIHHLCYKASSTRSSDEHSSFHCVFAVSSSRFGSHCLLFLSNLEEKQTHDEV